MTSPTASESSSSSSPTASGAAKARSGWRVGSVLVLLCLMTMMSVVRLNPSTLQSIVAQRDDIWFATVAVSSSSSSSTGDDGGVRQLQQPPVVEHGEAESDSSAAAVESLATTIIARQVAEAQEKQQQKENTKPNAEPKDSDTAKTTPPPTAERPPLNIVLFYADDWTFKTLGAMGNTYVKTPVLDQLASQGVLFTHNCVTTSICMQSRATLYTGQYASRHKTLFSWKDVTMYEEGNWNNTLYPTMLRNGYHVGFVGKYHHLEPPPGPTFSYFQSTQMAHFPRRGGGTKHVTEWNEIDAVDFLKARPTDKPFFLTVSYFATHAEDGNPENYLAMNSSSHLYPDDEPVPLPKTFTEQHWKDLPHFFQDDNVGRGRFRGRYDTPEVHQTMMKRMYRMATEVDAACGNILKAIQDQGMLDNTLVIFTTDNGNSHGEHGLAEKWYAYEESLRVPLIIKDPRMAKALIGTHNDEFTLNIDLAPTILSAAGIAVPSVMQGRDMSDLYKNERDASATKSSWRKEFFYEFFYNIPYYIPHSVALVGRGFKYIYWTDHDYTQYFDLANDPVEEFDIFNSSDKSTMLEMKRRLEELKVSVASGVSQ